MQSTDSEPQGFYAPSERDKLYNFMMNIVGQFVDKHGTMLTEVSEMSNLDISQPVPTSSHSSEDRVTNYTSLVSGLGFMAKNFHDAWKKGDGGRLRRCWKFLLLHFRANGRTKYAIEAFRLVVQTSARNLVKHTR